MNAAGKFFASPEDQLVDWVAGRSFHNDTRDECCPDFSCCASGPLPEPWPIDKRRLFQRADDRTREVLLLGAMADNINAGGAMLMGNGTVLRGTPEGWLIEEAGKWPPEGMGPQLGPAPFADPDE